MCATRYIRGSSRRQVPGLIPIATLLCSLLLLTACADGPKEPQNGAEVRGSLQGQAPRPPHTARQRAYYDAVAPLAPPVQALPQPGGVWNGTQPAAPVAQTTPPYSVQDSGNPWAPAQAQNPVPVYRGQPAPQAEQGTSGSAYAGAHALPRYRPMQEEKNNESKPAYRAHAQLPVAPYDRPVGSSRKPGIDPVNPYGYPNPAWGGAAGYGAYSGGYAWPGGYPAYPGAVRPYGW